MAPEHWLPDNPSVASAGRVQTSGHSVQETANSLAAGRRNMATSRRQAQQEPLLYFQLNSEYFIPLRHTTGVLTMRRKKGGNFTSEISTNSV